MTVFNEEDENGTEGKGRIVLVLERAEARDIQEAVEFAAEKNKRKSRWKSMLKKLDALSIW